LSSDTDTILKPDPRITRLAPYGYVLKYFSEKAKEIPHASFVAALQLEGIPCDGLFDEPVYKSSLFPITKPYRIRGSGVRTAKVSPVF